MSPDENQQPTNNEEEPQEDENMKLYRDEKQNSAELLEVLNKCDTISYNRRKNTFTFYAHEGALLEDVENADNMDLVKLANALDKRYFLEATIGCSNWNWDDEDEEDAKQEDEPKAEDQTTETKKEDKPMKKRYFYMSDINSTATVIESTKKELLSIAVMLKEEADFNFSNDDTISGYTKDGKFFYYDCTNFWDLKKSDIINAASIVYSNESDTEVYGAYYINECGVVGPSDDGQTTISCELKEVDREDYREDQTDEELIEKVENLCTRIDESIKEADQMIEEAENMMKEQTEEPAADQAEEPTADEIGAALMAELNESLDYFKRVIYDYLDGTRYESDINGDFWGCHECWFLLFHMNARLKTGGKTPFYALENEFCTLSECFEEIRCKYKYGDERTIENILEEYNLIKA